MLKAVRNASTFLQDEIRPSEEWIEGFFTDWDEKMKRYHGPGWRAWQRNLDDGGDEEYDPENFSYEWMSLRAAQLVLGNPRCRCSTTRSGPERELVKAHQLALNRWIRESEMRALNEKLVADYGFHRAIALVMPNQDDLYSDLDDPKGWPSAKRISPRRYVYDVHANEKEEELWRGHKTIHQKHELLERAEENPDEGWDAKAIEALAEDTGVEEIRGKGRGRENAYSRQEVVLYNIWVRDYKPTKADRKFHGDEAWDRELRVGAWLTLGVVDMGEGRSKSGWVRRPMPYWGHQRGPYIVIDALPIPDESVGLAQIPAVAEQSKELNVHARALSRAMRKYKKGILVDASDPDFESKIKDFEDHFVVGLDGLDDIDKKVKEVELGGATDQHLTHMAVCRERVQRNGGVTDIERGQTEAGVTATADQLASEASATKVGFDAVKFIEGIRQILENVSVYLAFDETRTSLGPEALRVLRDPETGQPIENAVYVGGIKSAEESRWFRSLSIEIEPYSMGSTSEALEQQRLLQLMNTIAVLLPMVAQYPFVLWDELLETIGEMMNIPNLSDYFDPEAIAQYQSLMLQGQQIEAKQGGMGVPQPRLTQDVSRLLNGRQVMPKNGNLVGAMQASAQRMRPAV